jgi:hypothetical protein
VVLLFRRFGGERHVVADILGRTAQALIRSPRGYAKLVEGVLAIFFDWWEIIPLVAAVFLVSLVLTAAFIEIRQRFF